MLLSIASFFILFWLMLFSFVTSVTAYHLKKPEILARKNRDNKSGVPGPFPTLIFSLCVLMLFKKIFGYFFVFPLFFEMSKAEIFLRTFIPSFVLFGSSGLYHTIIARVRMDKISIARSYYARLAVVYGLSIWILYRPWLFKNLIDSWKQTLPWLLTEMIVLEAVFNIPGLGFFLWNSILLQKWNLTLQYTLSIFVLYFPLFFFQIYWQRKIQKRLWGSIL